jgi:hypothetical protein
MNKKYLINPMMTYLSILLIICSSFIGDSHVSTFSDVLPDISDDSPLFTPNNEAGWSTLQTYVHLNADSVAFEVLFTRIVPENTDWTIPQLAGNINSAYAPAIRTDLQYKQPNRTWSVIITADGKCFLKWVGGQQPDHESMALPLHTKYKK